MGARLGVVLALMGCSSHLAMRPGKPLIAQAHNARGKASVVLLEVDGDLVILRVTNEGTGELMVDRKNVLLKIPNGKYRSPVYFSGDEGYLLQPGESHQVNVRFSMSDLDEEELVWLDFSEALFADGKPLEAQTIALQVR